MNRFTKMFNNLTAKRYTGMIAGDLPASRKNWGNDEFMRAAEISLYTNRALTKRADKVSEIQWILKDPSGNVVESHEVLDLLRNPNPVFNNGMQFWKVYQAHLDILGQAYLWKEIEPQIFSSQVKLPEKLHILNPTTIRPSFDDQGNLSGYIQQTAKGERKYAPEEIIRVFRPSPRSPWEGISLLKSGIYAIQTEQQIGAYHSRVLENGGKVEGVMKFKTDRLTKDQLRQNKAEYDKEYADARKAGRPLFLGGDAEYMKTGLTPDELSYLEAKQTTLTDICILTGVPKPLLGAFDDIQYSNAEYSIKIFLREEVYPLLKQLASAMEQGLVPEGFTLEAVDPTPQNKEETLTETQAGMSSHFMTINEARERHGLEEINGGDEIYAPWTLSPLGTSPASPHNIGGEGTEEAKKKEYNHPLRDIENRKVWHKLQIKRMDRREKPFTSAVQSYLDGQRDRLLEGIGVNKAYHYRRKDLFDEAINLEQEVKLGKELFFPVLDELVKEAAKNGADFAGYEYDINPTSEMTNWIDQRSDIFLRQINTTTFNTLRDQFNQSLEENETRAQLEERIRNTYDGIRDSRVSTIARTEVHGATQFGTVEGYKQAGLDIKIWVSVLDGETRGQRPGDQADHISLDGEERPIGVPFSNGLMWPGEPGASAAESVNCRCTI